MKIYLIRHALPEDTDYDDATSDDPPLSEEGQETAEAIANWMVENDEVPNQIYASPTARTQETAEILADIFQKAGFSIPPVKPVNSVGPHMSVRGLMQKLARDEDIKKPAIVSHHETISSGLRVLDEPDHPDPMSMAELRIMKVKRKDASWKEDQRLLPSDVGRDDHY